MNTDRMNLYHFIEALKSHMKAHEAMKTIADKTDPIYISLRQYCIGIEEVLQSMSFYSTFTIKRRHLWVS